MRSKTVLVADDSEVALRLCRRVLEKAGHEVLTASDALRAVSVALASSPDIILIDSAMPGMDSLMAMRQIKAERPEIAIVVMDVLSTVADRERYLAAGAVEVIVKPFRLGDLKDVVAKHGARKATTRPEEQTPAAEKHKAICISCGKSQVHLLRSTSGVLICDECARTQYRTLLPTNAANPR